MSIEAAYNQMLPVSQLRADTEASPLSRDNP